MELLIGGAYQGKLTCAIEKHALSPSDCHDLSEGLPKERRRCLYHLEAYSREAFRRGLTAEAMLAELALSPDSIVISREVGSGIVPMDPFERGWREAHGRLLRLIAESSEHITRVFCGIPEALK